MNVPLQDELGVGRKGHKFSQEAGIGIADPTEVIARLQDIKQMTRMNIVLAK